MARVLNGARYFFPERKNMAVPEGFGAVCESKRNGPADHFERQTPRAWASGGESRQAVNNSEEGWRCRRGLERFARANEMVRRTISSDKRREHGRAAGNPVKP